MSIKKESDMYIHIKNYFEARDFNVKSEIQSIDLMAINKEYEILVEMKTSFNLKLVYQALARQKISPYVYVAVPVKKSDLRKKKHREMCNLLKKLQIGLLALYSTKDDILVVEEFPPQEWKFKMDNRKKKLALQEFDKRTDDYNSGGVTKVQLVTAYREEAIFIACLLSKNGVMKSRDIRKITSNPKATRILYDNHYKWFDRVEKGTYSLNESGVQGLRRWDTITDYYMKKIEEEGFVK